MKVGNTGHVKGHDPSKVVTTEQKQGLREGSNHVTMPQAEGTSDIKCHSSIRKCLVKDPLLWHFYCCCSSLIYFLSFNYFHLNFIELFKLLSASRLLCILSLCLGHSFLCSHLSDFSGLHPRPWPMKPPLTVKPVVGPPFSLWKQLLSLHKA